MRKLFAAIVVGVITALAFAGVVGISKEVPMIAPLLGQIHVLLFLSSAWIIGELLWE